jgi:hypothetical protein
MDPRPGLNINDLVARSGFDRRTIVYYIQQGILPKVGRRGPRTRYPEECLTRLLFVRGLKEMQERGRLPGVTLGDMAYALAVLKLEKVRELVDRSMPAAEIEALFPARPAAPVAYGRPAAGSAQATWRATPPALPPVAASPPAAPPTALPAPPPANPTNPAAPRPSLLSGTPPADKRSYGLADAAIRQRLGVTRPPESPEPSPPAAAGQPIPGQPTTDLAGAASATTRDHEQTSGGGPALPVEAGDDLGELLRQLELRATTGRSRPPGTAEQWTEIPVTSRVYLSVRGLGETDAPLADAVARALKRTLRSR